MSFGNTRACAIRSTTARPASTNSRSLPASTIADGPARFAFGPGAPPLPKIVTRMGGGGCAPPRAVATSDTTIEMLRTVRRMWLP